MNAGEFDFDFWVGSWRGIWPAGAGTEPGSAVNTITRALAGKVIHEHFVTDTGAPFEGLSLSVFVEAERVWKQTWVDSSGGYLDFVGGRSGDGAEFHRSQTTPNGAVQQRMVFSDIEADRFEWCWQRSRDDGVEWQTIWPISYTRIE